MVNISRFLIPEVYNCKVVGQNERLTNLTFVEIPKAFI